MPIDGSTTDRLIDHCVATRGMRWFTFIGKGVKGNGVWRSWCIAMASGMVDLEGRDF